MLDLIVSLIPLALGVVISPLAIMALVAVLLSKRAKRNGIAFLIGWILAIVVTLLISFLVLELLDVQATTTPPTWVAYVRIILALILVVIGIYSLRRGRGRIVAMAHASTPAQVVSAAPQLPGWLRAVETFTPGRCGLLGFGIFFLNPVDTSCAVLAALDIRLATISTTASVVAAVLFAIVGIVPMAIPVIIATVRGADAQPFLGASRKWIASHTAWLNAGLLFLIAAIQFVKAFSALLKA
jgi:Sap, sulfolipid-1-addressing protein